MKLPEEAVSPRKPMFNQESTEMRTYTLSAAVAVVAVVALSGSAVMAKEMATSMASMQMGKSAATSQTSHKASATVKKLDEKKGVVTLAHGPVPSLNWPPMSMGFKVKDTALLPKLTPGKKVDVEFIQEGNDYVVTSVK